MSNSENNNQNNSNQDPTIRRKPPKDNRPKGTILTENFSLRTDKKNNN